MARTWKSRAGSGLYRRVWLAAPAPDTEHRLSRLAAWVQAAERNGLAYGLRLPGQEIAPGQGESHRRAALDLLALYR